MNIVNFTPVSALTGGLLIGLSVALFFILNGRMIGISGIASNFLVSKNNRVDNFLFLAGLILGPLIYSYTTGKEINISISSSLILFTILIPFPPPPLAALIIIGKPKSSINLFI